jgi:hypothetical protein
MLMDSSYGCLTRRAREALEKPSRRRTLCVGALSPRHCLVHVRRYGESQEQSQIALDLSAKLGREDQLMVQGRARDKAPMAEAVQIYRTLFGFFPTTLDWASSGGGADILRAARCTGNN